jgi:hypothetical protein
MLAFLSSARNRHHEKISSHFFGVEAPGRSGAKTQENLDIQSFCNTLSVMEIEIAGKGHFWTETDFPVAKKGRTGRSHVIIRT